MRRRRRGGGGGGEEGEEEEVFKTKAVNEGDAERDRATP